MSTSSLTMLTARSRRIVLIVAWVCLANYLLHLFPISLLSLFDVYPSEIKEQIRSDQTGALLEVAKRANAWLELTIGLALQVALALLVALFVCVRELVRLLFKGRKALSLDLLSYSLMFGVIGLAGWLIFHFVLGGFAVFAGTRAGGLGPAFILLMFGGIALASVVLSVMYLVEPNTTRRAMRQAFDSRYDPRGD
ncbi:hypothetical protein AAFO92_14585 [Roseovarius sp. CAU 1744]|uniref:hypothetical protein n=1 Tax=Roseovarius sp. CAU 1744 TaxID=3140368 RepID=UPI00325B9AF1